MNAANAVLLMLLAAIDAALIMALRARRNRVKRAERIMRSLQEAVRREAIALPAQPLPAALRQAS